MGGWEKGNGDERGVRSDGKISGKLERVNKKEKKLGLVVLKKGSGSNVKVGMG